MARPTEDVRTIAPTPVMALMAVIAVAAICARFFITTPLWLDEALSVNIAKLPISSIGEALRHDGHPPLYYVILHGWIALFGDGDLAVRALSAVISLLALPLAALIGLRLSGRRLAVVYAWTLAVSPFFLRYGSETRMYSLIVVLVMVGQLVGGAALRRPTAASLAATAAVTSALLWTHYWTMWLLAAFGVLLVIRVARSRLAGPFDRSALLVLGAMGVGGIGFLPWVPSMLYQSAHTGTPWAKSARPAGILVTSLFDFSGGPFSEPQVLALFSLVILVVGLFGAGVSAWVVELDFRGRADSRGIGAIVGVTFIIGSLATLALRSGFASRYASVYFPFVILLVALGLERFEVGHLRTIVLLLFCGLTMAGLGFTFRQDRTQVGDAADLIHRSRAVNPLVVVCPDQLGPATARVLPGAEVVAYPDLQSPKFVNWVDYAKRNQRSDPVAFADRVLERAGDRTIFVVFNTNYLTLEGKCEGVLARLGQRRPGRQILTNDAEAFYENANLIEFRGAPP